MMNKELRLLGLTKSNANASVAPPAGGQKGPLFSFFALVAAVVVTVSVEVWAVLPLIVMEVGFRLQVGILLTPVIAVVTLQVRVTVPLNPFVPATLMVPVFPVVAPGVTVMDVVPPDPGAKLGAAVTLRLTLVFALSEPEVPVIVTVTALEVVAADALALRVNTCVPAVDPFAKLAETPLGRPVAASVTVPLNPPESATVMVLVPVLPWATDRLVGAAESVKPGGGWLIVYAAVATALVE